jgi:DNA-binding NtrC family response regulator
MHILIVGSMSGQLAQAALIAKGRGARVHHADDIVLGMEALRSDSRLDLVMCELSHDVGALIAAMRGERMHIPVIACGTNDQADAAVRAIRAGAKDFLPLPPDAELIAAMLEAIAGDEHNLVYADPAMASVVRRAEQIAPSEANVLITGESGTGKEVLAGLIHRKSHRAGKAWVAVNCAAIPEALLESELFGHEKGAFSGAVARRIGKFEAANGGTLLLDEIGEMDLRLQAKLLRAVQEREIDRVGGSAPVKLDVRLIATTNRDLQEDVRLGRFRADLFFRLNVISVRIPPLRERPGDIAPLAAFFAHKFAEVNARDCRTVSPEALTLLSRHSWPGNVRELESVVHRGVLLGIGNTITPAAIELDTDLPPLAPSSVAASPLLAKLGTSEIDADDAPADDDTALLPPVVDRTIDGMEKALILATFRRCLGDKSKTATVLGISIRTLRNKLHNYERSGTRISRSVVVAVG